MTSGHDNCQTNKQSYVCNSHLPSFSVNQGFHLGRLYVANPATSTALPAMNCAPKSGESCRYGIEKVKAKIVRGVMLELVKDCTTAPAQQTTH